MIACGWVAQAEQAGGLLAQPETAATALSSHAVADPGGRASTFQSLMRFPVEGASTVAAAHTLVAAQPPAAEGVAGPRTVKVTCSACQLPLWAHVRCKLASCVIMPER